MFTTRKWWLLLVAAPLVLWPNAAKADGMYSQNFTVAAAGPTINNIGTSIAHHQLTWNVVGTASVCTVALDTSADGVTWSAGGGITGQTCTSNGTSAVTAHIVNYVRIHVTALTVTAGSRVNVTWNGYVNLPSGGGSVTSITATGPVVVTPSPITNTGVISCPTCNTSSATIAGSIANTQVAVGTGTNTIGGNARFTYTDAGTQDLRFANSGNTLEFNGTAGQGTALISTNDGSNNGIITLSPGQTEIFRGTLSSGVRTVSLLNSGTVGSYTFTNGLLTMFGATSGSATMATPTIAGTITNPFVFSNYVQAPSLLTGSDGVHNGEVSLICNTTNAALPSNTVSLLGCTAASNTAWGITLPTAEPASAGVLHLGTASSHYSAATVSAVSLSADVTGTLPNASVAAAPLPTPGSTCTFTAPRTYCICTTTCTITVPVPAAGYEFCALNSDNVNTVITMSAIGSSARYENTARTAYGTAGTGTFVSGGAVADKACLLGLDSTHYLTVAFNGTWTAN